MKNTNLFHLTLLVFTILVARQPVSADPPPQIYNLPREPRFRLPVPNTADDAITSKTQSEAPNITLKNHLTRLLSFPSNVLNVLVVRGSSTAIVGMQKVNPRTIAITGKSVGKTSIAVFTERFNNDTVGRHQTYAIEVVPSASGLVAQVTPTGLVAVNAEKILHLLGRSRPDDQQSFEQMLIEEIEKRDKRIKELESK